MREKGEDGGEAMDMRPRSLSLQAESTRVGQSSRPNGALPTSEPNETLKPPSDGAHPITTAKRRQTGDPDGGATPAQLTVSRPD